MIDEAAKIFRRSCLSLLSRFCNFCPNLKKMSVCPQCAQLGPPLQAAFLPSRQQQRQHALPCFRLLHTSRARPLESPRAIPSPTQCLWSLWLPKHRSSPATSLMMSRRQSRRNQTSPKTDFTTIISNCWATFMATSWAWRVYLGFVRTSPAGGASAKKQGCAGATGTSRSFASS